jgi:hypothetical protein
VTAGIQQHSTNFWGHSTAFNMFRGHSTLDGWHSTAFNRDSTPFNTIQQILGAFNTRRGAVNSVQQIEAVNTIRGARSTNKHMKTRVTK